MVTLFGKILKRIELFWLNIRTFAFRNRTILELIFILIYSGEQGLLILLAYLQPEHIKIFITLFALIILTTFSIHRLVTESRIKVLEQNVEELRNYTQNIRNEAENLSTWYHETLESYNKLLEKFKK